MPKSDMVQSLLKALDILELAVAAEDGVRLNEITDKLGLHKSTAHNLARTLLSRGYLSKDSLNRYQAGPVLEEIHRSRSRRGILRCAGQVLERLQQEFPAATLTFSELAGSEICCRLRLSPDTPGGLRRPPAQTFSAFSSASGLCLQAFNAEFRERMSVPGIFEESGHRYWQTREDFTAAVADSAKSGLAKLHTGCHWRLAAPVNYNFALGMSLETDGIELRHASARLVAAAEEIAADN